MLRLLLLVALCLPGQAVADIRVVDYSGRTVELTQPAARIVGLSPHIIENLFAAGLGERVVGAVAYADYPAAAGELPRVGRFDTYDVEAILALQPDLVIAWGSGNGQRVVQQLTRLGIPVYVDEPRRLNDIARSLRDFAALTGGAPTAIAAAENFRTRLARFARRYDDKPAVSVMYQVWHQPLQTINGEHVISAVIELCGGRNVFADAVAQAPKINMEAVIARDPQVIVASGVDGAAPAWLDTWQAWPNLTAVQRQTIFHIPPDVIQRHTPRILQGAELMCRYLEQARAVLFP